jgi:hypothetical protein
MLSIQIHAGTHKTASTAIQRTLREVRADLAAQGIVMPGLPDHKAKHSDFRHELGGKKGRETPGTDQLLADIAALGGQGRVLITNETLIGADPAALRSVLDRTGAGQVDIYFYVRPQIGLLTSLYLQSVKNGRVCTGPRDYMQDKGDSSAFDFGTSIEGYAHVFGKDNVHVREFTRDGLVGGSIIADLWDFLDLPADLLPKALAVEEVANFTPKAEVAEFLRALGQFWRVQTGTDPRGIAGPLVFSVFRALNELAPDLPGTPYRLPLDLQEELDARFTPERQAFAERWFARPPTRAWLTEKITPPEPMSGLPHPIIQKVAQAALERMSNKNKATQKVVLSAFMDRLPVQGDMIVAEGLADWAAGQTDSAPIPSVDPATAERKAVRSRRKGLDPKKVGGSDQRAARRAERKAAKAGKIEPVSAVDEKAAARATRRAERQAAKAAGAAPIEKADRGARRKRRKAEGAAEPSDPAGSDQGSRKGRKARRQALLPRAQEASAELSRFGAPDISRRFDFIVAGTARSGTTAVTQYLQTVWHMHCGMEVFGATDDHTALHPPHCFFEAEIAAAASPGLSSFTKFRRSSLAVAEKAPQISSWGNKSPSYIYRLNGVLAELPRPRAVVLARSVMPVAESYVKRALNPEDTFGHGRTGIYAIGDWMALAHALAIAPGDQVLVLPYRGLIRDWRETISDVCAFVSPGTAPEFDEDAVEAIRQSYVRRRQKKRDLPWEISDFELEAVRRAESFGLDAILDADRPYLLSTVQPKLRDAVARLPDIIPYIQGLTAGHPVPAAVEFFETWARQVGKLVADSAALLHPAAPETRTTRKRPIPA